MGAAAQLETITNCLLLYEGQGKWFGQIMTQAKYLGGII